jgi:hypothetical protein
LVQTVRPVRQLLAFPDDNTGKDIWNGVSQRLILYGIRPAKRSSAFVGRIGNLQGPRVPRQSACRGAQTAERRARAGPIIKASEGRVPLGRRLPTCPTFWSRAPIGLGRSRDALALIGRG